jgi:alkylation response protein AidB-like acyl-CoA dehydrogenase
VSAPRNIYTDPMRPSFLEELYQGRFRWDLAHPFPEQAPADRVIGDRTVAGCEAFLTSHVDPTEVDDRDRLPPGFLDELRQTGYLKLQLSPELGGLDLSNLNAFRVIQTSASWSAPVNLILSVQNAIGVGALLPYVPDGPLAAWLAGSLAHGAISGFADTEPEGAANARRFTTATLTDDGKAYVLSGEKLFIGNAPISEILIVSATVHQVVDGKPQDQVRLFFVDTKSPGFRIVETQHYMGLRGFPNGALILDQVRVPADRMFVEPADAGDARITPTTTLVVLRGRLYLIAASAQAMAIQCLRWCKDFLTTRTVDGVPLGRYQEIQQQMATSVAETFAIESVTSWILLQMDAAIRGTPRPLNLTFEQNVSKNISSDLAWRVLDRSMSLQGAAGYETATSKAVRGAEPIPLERFYRDARSQRISGGVDFLLDYWTSKLIIFSYYYPPPSDVHAIESVAPPPAELRAVHLSRKNHDHLDYAARTTKTFARTCLALSRDNPDPETLFAQEHRLIQLNRIANELLTMSLSLSRADHLLSRGGNDSVQDIVDVYCTAARERIERYFAAVAAVTTPNFANVSDRWIYGDELSWLATDVITTMPPALPRKG